MAGKSQSTRLSTPNKSTTAVVTDNRLRKSPEMIRKLLDLGVPRAPAETFPLTLHLATKRWCKKLRTPHGPKVYYFGALADWQGALDRYDEEKADLIAGRAPAIRNKAGLRLIDLCNQFLHHKRGLVTEGTLTLHSW